MYCIETFDLTKKYQPPGKLRSLLMKSPLKGEITAVNNVNLQIKQGEIFGLLGPNGAGKTTLIKMLCTLLWPSSGSAKINGYDLLKSEQKIKKSIGLVTAEERSFYWRLTGRQNLEFFAPLYGLTPIEAKKRIDLLLKQLDLSKVADNMFYSYSSGMKQKLSLARGLLCNPKILFLDEPTKSVDVITSRELRNFIKNTLVEDEKRTVILTTHRLEEAEILCDRIAIINKGCRSFCGSLFELKQKIYSKDRYNLLVSGLGETSLLKICNHPSLKALTISNTINDLHFEVGFTITNGNNPLSSIIQNLLAEGGNLLSCQKNEPKLEELFTDFIKEQTSVVS